MVPGIKYYRGNTRRALLLLLAVLAVFLTAIHLVAQPSSITFDRISVEQGLPSPYVTTIYQDSRGFIWFGTDAGLCRYDGLEVKIFKNSPADTASLAGNGIWSLCQDGKDVLWVGTYDGGLNRLDLRTEQIKRFNSHPSAPEIIRSFPIKALMVDQRGMLWIGTFGGGIAIYDPAQDSFSMMTHEPSNSNSLADNVVFSIIEDKSGTIWIGTSNGLSRFNPQGSRFTNYRNETRNPASLSNNVVVIVFQDAAGTIWAGTKEGLNRLDSASGTFEQFLNHPDHPTSLSFNQVYAVGEHRSAGTASLWVGTAGGGLNLFDHKTKRFRHVKNRIDDRTSLSDDNITSFFTDRTGTLWIGTIQGGANKINTEKKSVKHLRYNPNRPEGITKGAVYALAEDNNGHIWIGMLVGGINRYNKLTGEVTKYQQGPASGLASNDVTALAVDAGGTLWAGTYGAGLYRLEQHSGRFIPYLHRPGDDASLTSNDVDELYVDRRGNLWVGTHGGLSRFDRSRDAFVQYRPNPAKAGSLNHERVTVIRSSRDGKVYVGTEGGGLNILDPANGTFSAFKFTPGDTTSLSNDLVYALHEDRGGTIWVGTSNGLNRFDRQTGTFRRYFVRHGLASDYIKGILEDKRGNLWLVTARNISRFGPEREQFVNFDNTDGLLNIGFNDASLKSRNGEFYIGGSEGVDIFHPDSLSENLHVPEIVLTDFTVYNNPHILPQVISFTKEIPNLSWNQNFFSISFVALDYASPGKNLYAYTLQREDDPDWISSGTTRFANFTNLDHGTYIFRAMGSNNNGVWNRVGTTLRITIRPPFWKEPWFIVMSVLAVIGMLALAYNYRVSQLLKIERLRVRIASDLHDDVGSSLSAIALMTEMVSRKLPETSSERKQLSGAVVATRNTADALRDIVWLINPEHEKMDDMLLRMKDAAAKLLMNIDHSFTSDENGLDNVLDMEFRRNAILIYKEILNNTLRHSQATKVEIHVSMSNGTFLLRVKDNGKGFDQNTVKRGHGLNNLRARTKKIGGTLNINSTPGQGTTTELVAKIP